MRLPRRLYGSLLDKFLRRFPIVCILGPRQCGKTTFVKQHLPKWHYFDLEKPSHRVQVEGDPEAFLKRRQKQIIFDEAQQLPNLFPTLRSFVDEQRKSNGRIVLLGSASPHLIRNVSESLAGRVGFLDMSPFHIQEISKEKELWLKGGFPDAFLAKSQEKRIQWYEGYTRTFIERDLQMYGIEVNPSQMRRLWAMLAHIHGGIFNASELGNALGINYHTVQRYVEILEQTFLIRRLRPYFANVGKRLVKSPKIYLRDSGLLHYFLNIYDEENLFIHPKRGFSWEGFVIEQIMNALSLFKPGTECYFWQVSSQGDVDLLIQGSKKIIPVEIKLHMAPSRGDVPGLFRCMKDLHLATGYVIYPQSENYSLGEGVQAVSLRSFLRDFVGGTNE